MKRVALFVDVQNIYYTTRQIFARHFDYQRFWTAATHERDVVTAMAFAIARDDERQRQFQNILRSIGFDVKLKPYVQRSDGSAKGDWDVGITLEVLDVAARVDVIVLASGDGDFDLLVERVVERHGVAVEVHGVAKLTAGSLQRAATRFFPIAESLLLPGK